MTGETKKTGFTGATGETLAAALEMPDARPRAYALFAHCFTCSKDVKAAREISRALRARGYAVLRFDFTGLGGSDGDFANTNFSSNVDDLIAAADFLRNDFDAPSLLIGHSLGGAAAIVAAGRIPEIKSVAVIGAPSDADHVVAQMKDSEQEIRDRGEAVVSLANRPFKIKAQYLDDLKNQTVTECAATLKKPLLILHAPRDETVGIDNATKIFVAAKHPKSFVSLDTADHLLSNTDDARYAASVIAAWGARYLPAADDEPVETRRIDGIDGGAAEIILDRKFAVSASAGDHAMTIDADKDDGGDGLGPNPTRLVEAALAACSAMTMRMYARRKGWSLDGLKVLVSRAKDEDAHLSRVLEKSITVSGDIDQAQRERLHEIAGKCPVHRMLADGVEIRSKMV